MIKYLLVLLLFCVGCSRDKIERVEWTTMGTTAAVQWRGKTNEEMKQIVEAVKETFAEIEKLLNAHSPTSEISRLAPLPYDKILTMCHPLVKPCYWWARSLQMSSEGAFNPRWRGEKTLDLGGIAKGFALDVAAERIRPMSTQDILLDIGGNLLSVRGTWRTGVYGTDKTIELTEGMSCATSAEYFRGKHIVDGRTGQPVTNNLKSVTVIIPAHMHESAATLADGLSTSLFVLGKKDHQKATSVFSWLPRVIWVMNEGIFVTP